MHRSQTSKSRKFKVVTVSRTIRGIFMVAMFMFTCAAHNAWAQMGGPGDGAKRGASLNIEIYTVDGGLIDLPVQAVLSSPGSMSGIEQAVSNDGVIMFSGLAPGSYLVTIRAAGFRDTRQQIDVMGDGIVEAAIEVEPERDPAAQPGATGFVLAPEARKNLDLGLAAMRASKFPEAQQHLDAAYKLAPGDPNVNVAMAQLCMATNDLPRAEEYVDHATSIDPNNLNALLYAGQLRIMQNDPAGARPPLEHAIDVAPRNKFAHWLLGITYLDLGLYEKAKTEATEVVTINKSVATDGEFLLGEALAKLGRTTEAIETLQTFVKKAPRDTYTPWAENLIVKLQSQSAGQNAPQGGEHTAASGNGTNTP
jgi:Flp pilus assembly protein TadD